MRRWLLAVLPTMAVLLLSPLAAATTPTDVLYTDAPPTATVGTAYSYQLQVHAYEGFTPVPPFSFTYKTGSHGQDSGGEWAAGLPLGLSMDSSGLITGTPLVPERTQFFIHIVDSSGQTSEVEWMPVWMTVSSGDPGLDQGLVPAGTAAVVLDEGGTPFLLQPTLDQVIGDLGLAPGAVSLVECWVTTNFSRYCQLTH